jgi:mono/diheme cytochrome c family protein
VLAALALVVGACHQQMAEQPRCEPLGTSPLFADGKCAREPVAGTVPRGGGRDVAATLDPKADRLPVPVTRALLARGHERFDIYCSPCHGRIGDGQGMIVQRGFKNPSTFHVDRLRNERAGYFFDVMTNGFSQMSSYASQITPEDRWAIVAWIRTLQASQNMPREFLAKEDEGRLDSNAAGGEAEAMAQKSFLEGEEGHGPAQPATGSAASPASVSGHSPSKKSESSEPR